MRIQLKRELCIGSGACVMEAPKIFDQDDEGIVLLRADAPSAGEDDAARTAASACPATVIEVLDD